MAPADRHVRPTRSNARLSVSWKSVARTRILASMIVVSCVFPSREPVRACSCMTGEYGDHLPEGVVAILGDVSAVGADVVVVRSRGSSSRRFRTGTAPIAFPSAQPALCGNRFVVGTRILVFVRRSERGLLETNGCMHNQAAGDVMFDELTRRFIQFRAA